MNIKPILLTFLSAATLTLSATAQTARQVLDQTAAKLKAAGGIEATFEGTQFKGTTETGQASGTIQVQGQKLKINTPALTTWFDGRTQWTLMSGSDEVNVSKPTAEELQQINPYHFVNLYKRGYDLRLAPTTYGGKACHEVRLTAQDKGNKAQLIILVIDKQTMMPRSIRIKDNRGNWNRVRVNQIHTGKRWSDANFKFDPATHPGIEVIDLS